MRCELCGKPALALVRTGKKRSRAARAGHPRKIPQHSLCAACWEKQGDSQRTATAMRKLERVAVGLLVTTTTIAAELATETEAELRAIIAEARAALASGNVAQAERVLAKEAA